MTIFPIAAQGGAGSGGLHGRTAVHRRQEQRCGVDRDLQPPDPGLVSGAAAAIDAAEAGARTNAPSELFIRAGEGFPERTALSSAEAVPAGRPQPPKGSNGLRALRVESAVQPWGGACSGPAGSGGSGSPGGIGVGVSTTMVLLSCVVTRYSLPPTGRNPHVARRTGAPGRDPARAVGVGAHPRKLPTIRGCTLALAVSPTSRRAAATIPTPLIRTRCA